MGARQGERAGSTWCPEWWVEGEERLGRDPLGCHICVESISENSMGQPGNYVIDGGSRMRACLGLCLGRQLRQYTPAP